VFSRKVVSVETWNSKVMNAPTLDSNISNSYVKTTWDNLG